MNKNALPLLLIGLFLWACSPQKNAAEYSDDVITSEILVTLETGAKVEELIQEIENPVFSLKKTLSARMNIFLFEYDDHKYDPKKALETLKKHSNVKSAEFNKRVGIRD